MGEYRYPRLWLAVAAAALLAMAAVVWVPTVLPLATSQSPVPAPGAEAALLPPLAKVGLTLLVVALGAAFGVGVILVTVSWYRRGSK